MPPRQWIILEPPVDWAIVRRLPRGTGILLLGTSDAVLRQARRMAARRNLAVVSEARGDAVRVHNLVELRQALLRRTPLILLSPLYPTGSHPEWRPLPRMRAAAMARLGKRRLVALGGMDSRRYAKIAKLGFQGWAGISAWSPTKFTEFTKATR